MSNIILCLKIKKDTIYKSKSLSWDKKGSCRSLVHKWKLLAVAIYSFCVSFDGVLWRWTPSREDIMHWQSIPHPFPGSYWIKHYIHQTPWLSIYRLLPETGCFNLEKLLKVKYLQRVLNSITASVVKFVGKVLKQINTTAYLGSNRATKVRFRIHRLLTSPRNPVNRKSFN